MKSLKMISAKCMLLVAEKALLSGIVLNIRNTESVINKVNDKIATMCKEKTFIFISNNNISCFNLFNNRLNLIELNRCVIANNFIYNLNNFSGLPDHHPNTTIYTPALKIMII